MRTPERRSPTRPEPGTRARRVGDRRSVRAAFIIALVAGVLVVHAAEPVKFVQSASISTLLQGREVYQKNCATCHGQAGDGRGEMGLTVKPRPRNFRAAVFKFRSTPSGTLPTDEDLARTIRHGLTGTAMPIFGALREPEMRAVIAYVKSFSPRWDKEENYAAPILIPAPPDWLGNAEKRRPHGVKGKAWFTAACAPCHGPQGDGHGLSSIELKDSFGEPATPSNLLQPLRCGPEPMDLYRTLVTGLDGTPMPSFFGALTEEQLWEIVAHVMELRQKQ